MEIWMYMYLIIQLIFDRQVFLCVLTTSEFYWQRPLFVNIFTPETTAITSSNEAEMEEEWWYTEDEQPTQAHPARQQQSQKERSLHLALGFAMSQECHSKCGSSTHLKQHLSQIHTWKWVLLLYNLVKLNCFLLLRFDNWN